MSRAAPDDGSDDDDFSSADEDAGLGRPRGVGGGGGDDDFDEFEDSVAMYNSEGGGRGTQQVTNQHYDEAMALSESDGGDSINASPMQKPTTGAGGAGRGQSSSRPRSDAVANQPFDEALELSSEGSVDDRDEERSKSGGDDDDDDDDERSTSPDAVQAARAQMQSSQGMSGGRAAVPEMPKSLDAMKRPEDPGKGSDDDDFGNASGGGDAEAGAPVPEGMYDPEEYSNLVVSAEIKELFQYITRYKAHNIELETKMRPFIPDYIPAVGDIDPFIKVPRPDGKTDNLGLTTLDEPASIQSDPTVLTLQLRAVTKSSGAQPMLVRSVEQAEKDPKAITGWINSISELHRHKPAPSVRYSKTMPDIEALMQVWPQEMEELLDTHALPGPEINLDLPTYARMVCTILDIPVHDKLTESLHVLFTLYSEFKQNVHFQQQLSQEQQQQPQGVGGFDGGAFDGGAQTLDLT